jgi:hypothetical protein
MDIGYISAQYQSATYFNHFEENMLGLSPMLTEDKDLLARQFLYQFTTTGDQQTLGLLESYAFNAGESFVIGGNPEDYEMLVCADGKADMGTEGF